MLIFAEKTIMELIFITLTVSLAGIGIHASTWRGMIFHRPSQYLKGKLPKWIHKPLFSCPICMSSVWSVVYFAVFGLPDWVFIPLVILMVAGLNTVIVSLISTIIPDEEDE
jgi:hypothetical protein